MSTALDRKAYNQRKIWRDQQKTQQKKEKTARINAKAKLSKEQVRQNEERAKRQADFEARQAAAKKANEAAQKQHEDDKPREAQAPDEQGRFVGKIDLGRYQTNATNIGNAKTLLAEMVTQLQTGFEAWGVVHDRYSSVDEEIQATGDAIVLGQAGVDQLLVWLNEVNLDVATIFRARKGEQQ